MRNCWRWKTRLWGNFPSYACLEFWQFKKSNLLSPCPDFFLLSLTDVQLLSIISVSWRAVRYRQIEHSLCCKSNPEGLSLSCLSNYGCWREMIASMFATTDLTHVAVQIHMQNIFQLAVHLLEQSDA